MFNINKILDLNTINEIESFIKTESFCPIEDFNKTKESRHWKPVGGNEFNNAAISQLTEGEKGIIERITNAVDAITERTVKEKNYNSNIKLEKIISENYPKYDTIINGINVGSKDKLTAGDAGGLISIVVNSGSNRSSLTIDIIDRGIGIASENFKNTILSIHEGNKGSMDKSYLIGAFGQGGSTSLNYTLATLIVSKHNNELSFTIVKSFDRQDLKQPVFYYLVDEETGEPYKTSIIEIDGNEELSTLNNESTYTLVKMIDTDISQNLTKSSIKPGGLVNYIDTEIPYLPYPVKVVEYRKEYFEQGSNQVRYAYGIDKRLKTSAKIRKEYTGEIEVLHNNIPVIVKYFVILPIDEAEWGDQKKCNTEYIQFNTTSKSLLYTAGGQYINGEYYTKIKNVGLHYLEKRLLVLVDIDVFGRDKFKFFTSNRAEMTKHKVTHNFFDTIVKALKNEKSLIEINDIIFEKSVSSNVDIELNEHINQNLKEFYGDFLKNTENRNSRKGRTIGGIKQNILYNEEITSLVCNPKKPFYKNQSISLVLQTGAYKNINSKAEIYLYIDGKQYHDLQKSFLDGRIQYTLGEMKPGNYDIKFQLFNSFSSIESDNGVLEVLDEFKEDSVKTNGKEMDFEVVDNDFNLRIVEIHKDIDKGSIVVAINLNHELLKPLFGNGLMDSQEVKELKAKIKGPIILYALSVDTNKFLTEEKFEETEYFTDLHNNLINSFAESYLSSLEFNKKIEGEMYD